MSRKHLLGGRLRSGLIVGVAISLLAGCGGQSSAGSPTKGGPVKIGFILALTGAGAGLAPTSEAGVTTAVASLNANPPGGHKIEIVKADDATDPATAATQCSRLVTQQHVQAIVAFENTPAYIACNSAAKAAGIPLLQSAGGAGVYCAANFFNTGPTNAQRPVTLIDFLSKRGSKKFFFVGSDIAAAKATFAAAASRVTADGGTVVGASYEPLETSDWSSDIDKLASSGADTVVTNIVDASAFYRQLAANAIGKKITIADATVPASQISSIGAQNLNGAYFTALYLPTIDTEASRAFVQKVRAVSGLAPDDLAAETYYSMMMLGEAIREAGDDVTPAALIRTLKGMSYDGPAGTWTYTSDGMMKMRIYVYKIHATGSYQIVDSGTTLEPGPCSG
jgi:ABC-type branched-subunit amino acid transport system substrate-binding protein